MSKNNDFDTADALTDDDYKEINEIKEIRKRLVSYIKVDKLIDFIKKCINESDYIDFKNERASKFIDKRRPVYYITIHDDIRETDKYKHTKKFANEDQEASYYTDVIYKEVATKVTNFINQCVRSTDEDATELKDFIKNTSLFEDLPSKEENEDFYSRLGIISMMFAVRLERDNKKNIVLEILL